MIMIMKFRINSQGFLFKKKKEEKYIYIFVYILNKYKLYKNIDGTKK